MEEPVYEFSKFVLSVVAFVALGGLTAVLFWIDVLNNRLRSSTDQLLPYVAIGCGLVSLTLCVLALLDATSLASLGLLVSGLCFGAIAAGTFYWWWRKVHPRSLAVTS